MVYLSPKKIGFFLTFDSSLPQPEHLKMDSAALSAVKESGITDPLLAAAFALGFTAGGRYFFPKYIFLLHLNGYVYG